MLAFNAHSQVRMSTETELLIQHYAGLSDILAVAPQYRPIKPEFSRVEFIDGRYYLPLLAKRKPAGSLNDLIKLGVRITWNSDLFLNMLFPMDRIGELNELTCLEYVESPGHIYPNLDRAIVDLRADSVHRGIGLDMGYTGKDVIIGVIDWGFDYTHPTFYDTLLEKYRIIAAWDQFKKSGPAPQGYDYGTAYYTKDDLIEAGTDTSGHSPGIDTHGSHVTGIAAGSGGGSEYRGVAYDAELLFASPDRDVSAYIDATHWMQEIAKREGKRLVINMSFGNYHKATMDGKSIGSIAIDQLVKDGVVMVTSAGNNGNSGMHVRHDFNGDTISTGINFLGSVSSEDLWGQAVIIWGSPNSDFGVAYRVYEQSRDVLHASRYFHTSMDKSDEGYFTDGTDTCFYTMVADSSHPVNDRAHMVMKFRITNLRWKVAISATSDSGEVHFWNAVEGERSTKNWGRPFESTFNGWLAGNDSFTVSDPGTTTDVITVGAHIAEIRIPNIDPIPGAIGRFSSKGPIMGRSFIKPDVTAPGVGIASAISSFTTDDYEMIDEVEFNGRRYPFARFSGTSMSSPAVTGVVALMLEANPRLSAFQVKEILKETTRWDSRMDSLGAFGNMTWGTGKTTAYRAIQQAVSTEGQLPVAPIGVLFPNPATAKIFYAESEDSPAHTCEVYNELGQLVIEGSIDSESGLKVDDLTPGLYFLKISESGKVIRFIKL